MTDYSNVVWVPILLIMEISWKLQKTKSGLELERCAFLPIPRGARLQKITRNNYLIFKYLSLPLQYKRVKGGPKSLSEEDLLKSQSLDCVKLLQRVTLGNLQCPKLGSLAV